MTEHTLPINAAREVEPKTRVLRYWKRVELRADLHATYDVVPLTEISNVQMSEVLFDALVAAIKKSGCAWELYELDAKLIESGT